jgi:hypothetical protein
MPIISDTIACVPIIVEKCSTCRYSSIVSAVTSNAIWALFDRIGVLITFQMAVGEVGWSKPDMIEITGDGERNSSHAVH